MTDGTTISPSPPLWSIEALLKATGGQIIGAAGGAWTGNVTGISIDTRTLAPGDLYVAIRGDRLDGHDYVAAAFEAGASAALVASDWNGLEQGVEKSGALIVVPETLEGMRALGRAARARSDGRIIAVTGSVGKTGTKEALKRCLSPQGKTHAAEKSFNNHWGVPLTLSRMASDCAFGIFEIGMNHPGEISPLTRMVRPHVAVITTVEPVHLEFFNDVEQIADAKAEIFDGLEPGGTAILNRDNQFYERLVARAGDVGVNKILSFGTDERADMRVRDMRLDASGSDVTASFRDEVFSYRLGIAGRHIVQNSLAILSAVWASGGDIKRAAARLADIGPQKGRGARNLYRLAGGNILVIDESYNANPASMRAALEALAGTSKVDYPRRIAVLGDMLELGQESEQLHLGLAEDIENADVDLVFASGPYMEKLFHILPVERQGAYGLRPEEISAGLVDEVRAGDIVMVKGSLASRMGVIFDALKDHLDGRLDGQSDGHLKEG